ncbi:MAG: hypothetical protein ACYSUQ_13520 [Planctomycetota bacterium]|jgi:hypothetical protein
MDVSTAIASALHSTAEPAQLAIGISNGQLVLILVILAVTALMMISTRRRLREARNSPKAYAREQIARLRDEQAVVQDVEEVMLQLEQLSRQIQARIDTRFAKLEAVIRDADGRIDRLERLLRQAEGDPSLDVTVDNASQEVSDQSGTDDDPRRRLIYELADAGRTPVQIAEEAGQNIGEVELILALRKTSPAASSRST